MFVITSTLKKHFTQANKTCVFPVAAQVPTGVALRSAEPHYALYSLPKQTSSTYDDRP